MAGRSSYLVENMNLGGSGKDLEVPTRKLVKEEKVEDPKYPLLALLRSAQSLWPSFDRRVPYSRELLTDAGPGQHLMSEALTNHSRATS